MFSYRDRSCAKFENNELPWLITSQRQYELDQLIRVYQETRPRYVLEIGTQEGGTLYQWIKHAEPGAVIVNVDILQNQPENNNLLERWHSWRRDDIELYSVIGYSQEPVTIETVKKHLPHGIDFLFIDGDHTYQGAKADFEIYGQMVNDGGAIAFHDLMTPKNGIQNHIQVGRLWREIQHAGYVTEEIWCAPDPDWGGIGVIYVQAQQGVQRPRERERQGSMAQIQPIRQPGHLSEVRQREDTEGERA